jgi:endonuclease YncB( thermonuclease family)
VTDEDKKGRNTYNLLIRLAGAQSPNIPFTTNKDEEPQTEPFAKEAKLFSEVRLLHRIVQLNLKGLDHKGDSFTAKISYAGKNVAEELIKAGFATFVEWNAPREDVDLLRATEG